MKFTILTSLFLVFMWSSSFAQSTYAVKGTVGDSVDHIKLANTSIAILNAKDSTLIKFTRTAADGSFTISGLRKGKFIVLMSYPDYADYVDRFSLDSTKQVHSFGNVNMQLKSRLLKEVIIKGSAVAIKVKGDTTEFNAAAYKIQPNAKVEDLLKQLPGIQIDKDGKITAQGQQVNKVLVDGEEFFGDDPTLVTKNIRADMVDKVQLYDKKSDQATFTGIDDGQKTKTLNIKLKEDKKNGFFGKTEEGGGTGGIYQSQVLFNAFKAKQKFSIYGTMGNNGKVGLGFEDNQKYGSGGGMEFGNDDGIIFFGGGGQDLDSFDGRYTGEGLPLARAGGVHYDTKWNSDKESINTNYKVGTLNVDGTREDVTQNNLPGNILNSTSDKAFHNYVFRQKLDAVLQVKLDTTSNLKISVDGTQKHTKTRDNYSGSIVRNDTLLNNNTRDLVNTVDQKIFNASAFYNKKFKKAGRTFSFSINEAYTQSDAKGFLNSHINFYDPKGKPDSAQIIDQYKTNDLKSSALNTNMTYSEPFSKTFSVILNYGISVSNSSADRRSFNPSAPGNYSLLVDSLSSNYKLNQFSNQGGAIFNYKKNKTIINFGTRVNDVSFHQVDASTNNVLDRNFINWAPQGSFQYRFSQQKSFSLRYNGNTTQPTLEQIQPLRLNTDPLNIVLGNPGLRPSFTHNFNIFYNSFKVISNRYIYFYGNYSFTTNPITTNISYNTTSGKSTSQALNLPGKQTTNFSGGGAFQRKFEKLDMGIGIDLNGNGNTYYNLVNGVINLTRSYNFNPALTINKNKEKKYDFYFRAGPTYTISQSSLQKNTNNNGSGFRGDGSFTIYLPLKFQIGSYSDYTYTAKTQSFNTDFSRVNINAFLIKTFLKSDNLKFTLWGNDLLNQNVGFNRSASANLITQSSYTTIKRYFMFSVAYDFTKMGGGAPKK